ncbi:MAG TPA: YqgE/AlgH family protein [Nevskiaceae bacterium]|nr:YqgE/AlgH family protein [Nevskiaceae bacterium]
MKKDESNFKNQFLIAMPGLEDSNFDHAVTLMCEHSGEGAIGLVINRPTDLKLSEMLAQMGLEHDALPADISVFWGGPVAPERGFVIHRAPGGWESCLQLQRDLYITTSRDILKAIGKGEGPKDYFVVLGYAGWGEGQLETEILGNSWLSAPASGQILFHTPARDRWKEATRLLGVDVTQLSNDVGHA